MISGQDLLWIVYEYISRVGWVDILDQSCLVSCYEVMLNYIFIYFFEIMVILEVLFAKFRMTFRTAGKNSNKREPAKKNCFFQTILLSAKIEVLKALILNYNFLKCYMHQVCKISYHINLNGSLSGLSRPK